MPRWIVVGAGVAGLAAAWEIKRRGEEVVVLEAGHRAGGMLQTFREGGFTVDAAAEAIRATPSVTRLLESIGLGGQILSAGPALNRRYVVSRGRLEPLGPKALAPLMHPKNRPESGESVSAFFRRVAGDASLPLADALVTGIYAGDPDRLSAVHALGGIFPTRGGAGDHAPAAPVAIRGGMATLVEKLRERLEVRTNERVKSVRHGQVFKVETGKGEHSGDRVVIATGPGGLLTVDPSVTRSPEATVSVMGLGFDHELVKGCEPATGYGFLCPEAERRHPLGVLFTSSVFPHSAPTGKVLWRVFLGGVRHPERATESKDETLAAVLADVRELLGLTLEPKWVTLLRHGHGIPQPELGHEKILQSRDRLERENPGLAFCGLGFEGVAVDQALESGIAAVDRASRAG